MGMIVYGWGDVVKHKQIMGYQWCQSCGSFAPRYLSKLVFRVHISYIPVFMKTKGYFIACKSCEAGKEITKQEFKALKELYKPMTKSMAKKCFKELQGLCAGAADNSETSVSFIFNDIASRYPVAANSALTGEYRQLITDLIGERIERQRALEQQQQQFAQQQAVMNPQIANQQI